MSDDDDWAVLAKYASLTEADLFTGMLEEAGIPVLSKGPMTGVFGPGFAGATAEGITLLVPSSQLEDARDLIGGAPPET